MPGWDPNPVLRGKAAQRLHAVVVVADGAHPLDDYVVYLLVGLLAGANKLRDWELYDGQHVVFQPSNMSVDELQQGNMRTWRKVYSYVSIAKRLRATPISKSLFLAANFGYRFYGRRLDRFYTCDWQLLQPESTPARPGSQAA